MGTTFDFLQGVNKGFWAGGAGAPVDTLTLALNALIAGGGYAGHKMGLLNTPPDLIEKPVGGSEWIADKMRSGGLLQDNPGSTADNIGNTLGGLLGPITAAKAPQIASWLLKAGENLAAPRTLNPQTGAIIWHGSPHKFDKFDSSKIGTGEGAQAYGHGLYLAESPDVATMYRNTLSDADAFVQGKPYNNADPIHRAAAVIKQAKDNGKDIKEVVARLNKSAADLQSRGKDWATELANEQLGTVKALQAGAVPNLDEVSKGSIYKVDLPDEHIAKMLDWDKPLSQQAHVLEAISNHPTIGKNSPRWKGAPDGMFEKSFANPERNGEWLYRDMLSNTPESANALRDMGIPGIRYLDGGSRGAGQGSSNFVVFPGNEGLLSILERNGMPIK